MQKLANIVTPSKNNGFPEIYNVVSSCEDTDVNLPTLYIGLDSARKCIDNFSILKKYYPEQNCWWTFSKTERRDDNITDIENFQEYVIINALKNTKYEYIDFIKYSLKRIKKLINYILYSDNSKICFLTRGSSFMFIYDIKLNTVFGLSLSLCEYCGLNKHKIIKHVKSNTNNEFINGTDFMNNDLKRIIGSNTHYILPLYCYFTDK